MAHYHSPSAETQNQGNMLRDRACVRQSKLFRQYESGNSVKALLGTANLQWNTQEKEGAFKGQPVWDHNTVAPTGSSAAFDHYRRLHREGGGPPSAQRQQEQQHAAQDHYHHDHNQYAQEQPLQQKPRQQPSPSRFPAVPPSGSPSRVPIVGGATARGNVHLEEIERKKAVRRAERQAAIDAERNDEQRVAREAAVCYWPLARDSALKALASCLFVCAVLPPRAYVMRYLVPPCARSAASSS